jgi:hypothetical protein
MLAGAGRVHNGVGLDCSPFATRGADAEEIKAIGAGCVRARACECVRVCVRDVRARVCAQPARRGVAGVG